MEFLEFGGRLRYAVRCYNDEQIVDDDNSGKLSVTEFKKVLKDYRVKIGEKDAEILFATFDRDNSGQIDYDEFLRAAIVRI